MFESLPTESSAIGETVSLWELALRSFCCSQRKMWNSHLLLQHHVCQRATKFPTMMIVDQTSETRSQPQLNICLYICVFAAMKPQLRHRSCHSLIVMVCIVNLTLAKISVETNLWTHLWGILLTKAIMGRPTLNAGGTIFSVVALDCGEGRKGAEHSSHHSLPPSRGFNVNSRLSYSHHNFMG